jgi:hypothetical protein
VRRYLAPKPPKPRTVWNRKKEAVFAAFPELFEGAEDRIRRQKRENAD